MRQLDLFLHVTDANGAPINILHMIADADDYVVNDARGSRPNACGSLVVRFVSAFVVRVSSSGS